MIKVRKSIMVVTLCLVGMFVSGCASASYSTQGLEQDYKDSETKVKFYLTDISYKCTPFFDRGLFVPATADELRLLGAKLYPSTFTTNKDEGIPYKLKFLVEESSEVDRGVFAYLFSLGILPTTVDQKFSPKLSLELPSKYSKYNSSSEFAFRYFMKMSVFSTLGLEDRVSDDDTTYVNGNFISIPISGPSDIKPYLKKKMLAWAVNSLKKSCKEGLYKKYVIEYHQNLL